MNPNIKEMMRQAQMLQNKMTKIQEELKERTVEASAGGGMVKVVVSGRPEIKSIEIDKEVVDPDDIEMLQDLIMAAINEALNLSSQMTEQEMAKLTGGLKIPGIF